MALKPTIYKLRIALSDLNRDYYDTLNLTVALHPSETMERMCCRLLAYCLNAQEFLVFTKGLSAVEQPDIWARSMDDQIVLWIDVGEPSLDRIKKSSRQSQATKVYCFNSKSDTWWQQSQAKMSKLKVSVYQFQWETIQTVAALLERTMDFSVTITGDSAYIATEAGEQEISWTTLQSV